MLQAERELADAVLGYDGLTPAIVAALCGGSTEAHSETALASALAAAVRRKRALGALADAGKLVDEVLPQAAAVALRDAHTRNGGEAVRRHMREAARTARGRELLLREAVCCGEDYRRVKDAAVEAVLGSCDADALRRLPAGVVTDACEVSFPLFDRYVAGLLEVCASGEGEGELRESFEAEGRLRRLLARHG